MGNFLKNGTVLPFGLLGCNYEDFAKGFNKTYKNTSLRVGMIINAYDVSDPNNVSKLTTEYDVVAIQQDENRGVSSTTYKKCMASEGMGSIADYFEKALRIRTKLDIDESLMNFKGQNGAIVLLLCLDALSEKAIIISSLTHPDRKTNLTSTSPFLEGEYNGVNIVVNTDGSTALTFKGPTDNYGNPTTSNGNTVFQIKTDGSFEFNHSSITIQADKSGVLTITTTGDANVTVGGNSNVTTSGDTNLKTTGTTTITSETIVLNKQMSGIVTYNGTLGVVDMITGLPIQPSTTTFGDI